MSRPSSPTPPPGMPEPEILLAGVNTIFESIGRALLCLDHHFRVAHVSPGVERLLGEGTARQILDRPIAELLGEELFGPDGSLRQALENGERREGWGASAQIANRTPRLLSLTAAPLRHEPGSPCDPRVGYVLVLRPSEEVPNRASSGVVIFSGLVSRSPKMHRLFELVEHLHESDATVLITGESGTGKELLARALHLHSPRRSKPFVAVNCGALPGELLESELFGHVRGAFTGAVRDRTGRFDMAADGTLFLDEVADVPLHLQVKLLRVLQERTFERVGESSSRRSDARIIAATNADLRQEVLRGKFREDLLYRLRVVPIEVPPLRERREDIEPLAYHLLVKVSRRHGRSLKLASDALRALLTYDWPGNVRELENALEFAVAVSRGQTIHANDLPGSLQEPVSSPTAAVPFEGRREASRQTSSEVVRSTEEDRIRRALDAHRWRREETAQALGMSRTTLWRKMREYGLA